MSGLKADEQDVLSFVRPDTLLGALAYLAIFLAVALLLSRALRAAVHAAMTRQGHIDRTSISFLQQICTALIWVIMLILYAHLIPALRSMGTALLAGASVASVVIGLAAQSTLGNLVAGIAITIYRPFRLGDTLQVATPTGNLIVLPNSSAASQVIINLNATYAPWPITITIRLSRKADLDQARKLALSVAGDSAGEKSVIGCFLTKMDAASITLELRLVAADAGGRDVLRSKLMVSLAERFSANRIDPSDTDLPAFS
jgi:small-conductance mechanosensitive channel